jgi:hypothetical protein
MSYISSLQAEKTSLTNGNQTSCQKDESVSLISGNQISYKQSQSPLSLYLIAKIQQLEASHSRDWFTFNEQTLSSLRQWKTIRIICQDFQIHNDQLFIISKLTNTIIVHPKISSFGNHCFSFCSNLTSIILLNSITSLGEYCFYECSNLTSIILPNSITSLGNCCFSGCSNLTSIILPNSITSLGKYCFSDCYKIFQPEFPNSPLTIYDGCFSYSIIYQTIINNQLKRDFPIVISINFNH